jgi:hypothetical protein
MNEFLASPDVRNATRQFPQLRLGTQRRSATPEAGGPLFIEHSLLALKRFQCRRKVKSEHGHWQFPRLLHLWKPIIP